MLYPLYSSKKNDFTENSVIWTDVLYLLGFPIYARRVEVFNNPAAVSCCSKETYFVPTLGSTEWEN